MGHQLTIRELTAERLRELLSYDADTGIFRRKTSRGGQKAGTGVSYLNKVNGYVYAGLDGKRRLAHRLAWLYVYGEWPLHDIDHVNGLRSDNRLCNLREATRSENLQNIRLTSRKNSSCGLLGATWDKNKGKWTAQISNQGKRKFLGRFETPEDAHRAYLKAKVRLHPFQTLVMETS